MSKDEAWPQRVVIAIDIDCFYVACERLRNPSLNGKPVGIKQKHILATCSYEARAFGVKKLQNAIEAKKMCPSLILVNGEDLTHYRRYSRAITRLVKSIVWQRRVERLGMDELFCDVTDMVERHIKTRASSRPHDTLFFDLSESGADEPIGFYYQPGENPSLQIPADSSAHDAQYAPQFEVAAHLAAYIRKRIFDDLRFTTSAGIAHNKLIAKLVGNLNKPNLQTTWNPDLRNWRKDQESFIDGFEVRQLQGFGQSIGKTIDSVLEKTGDDSPDGGRLTAQIIRDRLKEADLIGLFGARLGQRLWSLLHGDDREPVNPSPEYPVQISVEDSHYGIASFEEAVVEMRKLCTHLLQRLSEDLTEDIDGTALRPTGAASGGSTRTYWALYPTALRLTIRQGYDSSRQSISVAFPVDAIDEALDVAARADKLIKTTLSSLLRKLVKTQGTCRITIINICATNFTKERPDATVATMLKRVKHKKALKQETVDLTQLSSESEADVDVEQDSKKTPSAFVQPLSSQDDDLVFVGEQPPAILTCKECGSRLFAFSSAAHMEFHAKEQSSTQNGDRRSRSHRRKGKT